jgi:cob(I)alamin adenosyltransferase
MVKPRRSKLYTKTGDRGKTTLLGGKRVSKDNQRLITYGTLDELNASVGLALSFIEEGKITTLLQKIQSDLFDIGAELANPQKIRGSTNKVFSLENTKVEELENIIDQYDSRLKPLRNFILPGGTKAAASIHLARSITRRAERELVSLGKKEKVNQNVLSYLNRLSDLLFVLARYLNKKGRGKELTWKKD